jgi:hypothetical protein
MLENKFTSIHRSVERKFREEKGNGERAIKCEQKRN